MTANVHGSRALRDPALALWAVAGTCWLLLVGLALVAPGLAHHHGVLGALASGSDPVLVLAAFVGAWLVMVAAMMLPTTVPMVRLHGVVTARVDDRGRVRTVFLVAYFAVWFAFAGVALLGDANVHAVVERWGWLRDREGLVLAGALGLAGAVQFTPLTRRCLRVCRDPRGFLFQHYRRGVAAAWWLGVRHGASCFGLLLGADAGHVRDRCGKPVVDGRADRGHGGREDHPLGAAARGTSRCRAAVRGGLARPGGTGTCGR